MAAFLDTTAFSEDSSLRSAGWDSLKRSVNDGQLLLAVSEITVLELQRQAIERAASYLASVTEQTKKVRAHLLDAPDPQALRTLDYAERLRERLVHAGVDIVPLPAVTHARLLELDLAARRPFRRSGTGYRDALIWHSFLEWASSLKPRFADAVQFVSANKADFGDDKETGLHQDLVGDVPRGISVEYVEKLSPVIDRVRALSRLGSDDVDPTVVSLAKSFGLRDFQSLVGFPFDDLPIVEPYPEVPPIEAAILSAVRLDRNSVEAELVDSVNGIQIWDITCGARVTVQGSVYRGQAYLVPPGWHSYIDGRDDRFAVVSGDFDATLVADVRVDIESGYNDSALSQVSLRQPH